MTDPGLSACLSRRQTDRHSPVYGSDGVTQTFTLRTKTAPFLRSSPRSQGPWASFGRRPCPAPFAPSTDSHRPRRRARSRSARTLRRMCGRCLAPAIRQVRNLDSTGITTTALTSLILYKFLLFLKIFLYLFDLDMKFTIVALTSVIAAASASELNERCVNFA